MGVFQIVWDFYARVVIEPSHSSPLYQFNVPLVLLGINFISALPSLAHHIPPLLEEGSSRLFSLLWFVRVNGADVAELHACIYCHTALVHERRAHSMGASKTLLGLLNLRNMLQKLKSEGPMKAQNLNLFEKEGSLGDAVVGDVGVVVNKPSSVGHMVVLLIGVLRTILIISSLLFVATIHQTRLADGLKELSSLCGGASHHGSFDECGSSLPRSTIRPDIKLIPCGFVQK